MFGKRSDTDSSANGRAITPVPSNASSPAVEDQVPDVVVEAPVPAKTETVAKPDETNVEENVRTSEYYSVKTTVFNALIDTIDLAQLSQIGRASCRESVLRLV